jgi:hypothetical protein
MEEKFYKHGSFLCIDGPARKAGLNHSKMKVCFTCTDFDFLKRVLLKVVESEKCFFVKMSAQPRSGMFLGRGFFVTKEMAAEIWAKYKAHPRLMVTLQDDDFSEGFRAAVVSWKDKPADAVD